MESVICRDNKRITAGFSFLQCTSGFGDEIFGEGDVGESKGENTGGECI